ncbi:fimbrial protein [Paraburkholderia sp. Ac-20347]|uniref:fimbrial protein n=1 Tax=Paraburkholderia sp. Ac-20347 TaxID=2703892 RepID=UPI001980C11E|nr:fimbrial protein [Paraburkholderia sp. Ac-20347]MBN3808657.1 fimbrial protein [Paraburkholderia sp. Ac-20347]
MAPTIDIKAARALRRLRALRVLAGALLALLLAVCGTARASCSITGASQTEDTRAAPIIFGQVNLVPDTALQPVGSVLASTVVPPTNYTYGGATASTVLWKCTSVSDIANVYFNVATNGDDRVGGYWEIGNGSGTSTNDGLPGVYATWFTYAGLKLTMSGVTISRYWQEVPVTSYAVNGTGADIRLEDVPPIVAQLYRVSSLPPTSGAASNYCSGNTVPSGASGLASGMGASGAYICTQPNAYVALGGSGVANQGCVDAPGTDASSHYNSWGCDNGYAYALRGGTSLVQVSTCVVLNATPVVTFATVTVQQLAAGQNPSADFTVQVQCSDSAVSGTASSNTALGIQASSGAYSAAQTLGFVNSSNGVTYLLSDNYGSDSSLASGVGIALSSAANGTMNWVGQPGNTGTVPAVTGGDINYAAVTWPSGAAAGWYPVLSGATSSGSPSTGYTNYTATFTATLQQLPGMTATAGNVSATAYVLVKVQ